ncbi:MAG: fibronectin type III domain-containing protein [bacterium]|nr:fibronectin type III domain-containing protein [bacterium]
MSRKSKKQPNITLLVIVLMLAIFGLVAAFLIATTYFQASLENMVLQKQQQNDITVENVVTKISTDILEGEQVHDLSDLRYSEYASQLSGTAQFYPEPAEPNNFRAENIGIGDRILLTWEVPFGQSYEGVEINRDGVLLESIPSESGSFIDVNVVNGETYKYSIRSYRTIDDVVNYSKTTEAIKVKVKDDVPPAAPKNVSVVVSADNPVELIVSWDNGDEADTDHYVIYRSTEYGVKGENIGNIEKSFTEASDSTVEPGVTYYYTVTAVDLSGNESTGILPHATPGNTTPFGKSIEGDNIEESL